jgi:hypothetical protein
MNGNESFVPTVTGHGETLRGRTVLETLDPREERDIVLTDDGPVRRTEILSEEQQEQIALQE